MPNTTSWREIRARRPPNEQAAAAEKLRLRLGSLREQVGASQTALAQELGTSQSNVSQLERSSDQMLSSILKYVHALGGELKVTAVVGGISCTLLDDEDATNVATQPSGSGAPAQRPDASVYPKLNADFYDAEPWRYFEQRLAYLMFVASDPKGCRAVLSEPMDLGPLHFDLSQSWNDTYPTPEQSFAAIEGEVLLHHAAETVLRFVHAHADPREQCPWLRMSATAPRSFRSWVRTKVARAEEGRLAELCGRVFACEPGSRADLDAYAGYLRMLAGHFLDSGPYNAAKHGMGLTGGSERRELEVDGRKLFSRDGAVIRWLAVERSGDAERGPAWARASRQFSIEATIALIHVCTSLMKSVWIRGRSAYLDDQWVEVFSPPPPEQVFAAFDVNHPVLGDWFARLPSREGDKVEIVVKTRHIDFPDDSDESEP